MKVLITSGGTKIKIDRVRSITNMSRGTFGSQIADSYLKEADSEVYFLHAKESRLPMIKKNSLHLIEYVTFEDYERELFILLKEVKFDIIILAAAVSDYGVKNYVDGKIRSNNELVIHLKPLPKLISKVRDYAENSIICGFKLLVDSTEDELRDACKASIKNNRLDLIVGNDLRDIQDGNHKLLIIDKRNNELKVEKNNINEYCTLADVVKISCKIHYNPFNSSWNVIRRILK